MSDERHPRSALIEMLQGVGKGLQAIGQSPAFAALVQAEMDLRKAGVVVDTNPKQSVYASPDADIHVDGFDEPINLIQLRRTIGNIASSLEKVLAQALEKRALMDARTLNHLVRSTRSMQGLATLLRSDEVRSPFQDAAEQLFERLTNQAAGHEGEEEHGR